MSQKGKGEKKAPLEMRVNLMKHTCKKPKLINLCLLNKRILK